MIGDRLSGAVSETEEQALGRQFLRDLKKDAKILYDPIVQEWTELFIYKISENSKVSKKTFEVLLIEDITTTGNSVIEAAQLLEKEGLIVSQIITIISRNNNKNIFYKNVPIKYLYHIDDINNEKINIYRDIINKKNQIFVWQQILKI